MKKLLLPLLFLILSWPMLAQNALQVRTDPSYICGEGTGSTPSKADAAALDALLEKLSGSNVITGESSHRLRVWKTYYSDLRSASAVLFQGNTALRFIKWDAISSVFTQRQKRVGDLLDGASNAIQEGRADVARTYLGWVGTYLKTLPDAAQESARWEELRKLAGTGPQAQVNLKYIVRETADINRTLALQAEPEPNVAPVVKTAAEHAEKHVETAVTRAGKPLEPRLARAEIPSGTVSYCPHAAVPVRRKSVDDAITRFAAPTSKSSFGGASVLVRAALGSPLEVGAMAVYRVDGLGVYASYMSSFGGVSSGYECKSDGSTSFGYFWASGKEKKAAMSLSAGAVLPVYGPVEVYAGAGYGKYTLCWEDTSGGWAKVTDKSYNGIFCETGVIVRIGGCTVSGGIGTMAFKALLPEVGIGISF